MDKNKLNEIKDKVYEAEGLLELADIRPDRISDLRGLIERRLSEAVALCASLGTDDQDDSGAEDSADNITPNLPDEESGAMIRPEEAHSIEEVPVTEEEAPVTEEETPVTEVPDVSARTAETPVPQQVPQFCLNDRFRFRRVIFGGSEAEFNNTMEYVATLPSLTRAEDYFYGDMALDPEDPDVADFMEIIKNYFER